MRTKTLIALAAFGLSSSLMPAQQETILATANLAAPLSQTSIGARALALGSTYVGIAEGSSALLWNPAGLAWGKTMDLALHHNSGLADVVQETLLYSAPLGSWGGYGLGINFADYGAFEGRDANGNQTADYRANHLGVQGGLGLEAAKGLALGLALRGTSQRLGDQAYNGFAGDIGALWDALPALRLGLAYSNLGTVAGNSTAAGLRAGASVHGKFESQELLLGLSTQLESGGVNSFQCGVEDRIADVMALRAGYQVQSADVGYKGFSGASFGLGFLLSNVSLDYTFLPYGDLGSSQRISLGYLFNGPGPKAPVKKSPAGIKR